MEISQFSLFLLFFDKGCAAAYVFSSSISAVAKEEDLPSRFPCLIFMKIRRQRGNKMKEEEKERSEGGGFEKEKEKGEGRHKLSRQRESLYCPTKKKNERKGKVFHVLFLFCQGLKDYPPECRGGNEEEEETKNSRFPPLFFFLGFCGWGKWKCAKRACLYICEMRRCVSLPCLD